MRELARPEDGAELGELLRDEPWRRRLRRLSHDQRQGALDRLALWEYRRRTRTWLAEEARFRDFARSCVALDSLLGETE